MPAPLPADHDDDDGGAAGRAAARARAGRGLGAPAPAGHRDRRRAHRQPGAHALHHAGRVSRVRPAGTASPEIMNISGPFIRRPVATTLLTVGLALAGTMGFRLLPVAPLPQVDFP